MPDSVKIRITGDDSAFLETLRSVDAAVQATLTGLSAASAGVTQAWSAAAQGCAAALSAFGDLRSPWEAIKTQAHAWNDLDFESLASRLLDGAQAALFGAATGLQAAITDGFLFPGVQGADWAGAGGAFAAQLSQAASTGAAALAAQRDLLSGAAEAAVSGVGAAMNAASATSRAGASTASGWIRGFNARVGAMKSAARAAAYAVTAAFNAALGIASPSKVFERIGRYTGEGFILGYEKSIREAQRTARSVTNSLTGAANFSQSAPAAAAQAGAARASNAEDAPPFSVDLYIGKRKIAEATADANARVTSARARRVAAGWGHMR